MRRLSAVLIWTFISLLGAASFAWLALSRGESVNAAWLLVAALCTYAVAYRFYSRFIASQIFALDPARPTMKGSQAGAPPREGFDTGPKSIGAVKVLRISVTDRGPGVARDNRERIFERFWRGAGARAPGAGLGLPIVAEIMKAHGGTVVVGDAAGGGAIFTLAFSPVAPPAGGRG